MTSGFIKYWEHTITQPESLEYAFARKLVDIAKVVFSKTLDHVDGQNVRVENSDLSQAVTNSNERQERTSLYTEGQRSSPR